MLDQLVEVQYIHSTASALAEVKSDGTAVSWGEASLDGFAPQLQSVGGYIWIGGIGAPASLDGFASQLQIVSGSLKIHCPRTAGT